MLSTSPEDSIAFGCRMSRSRRWSRRGRTGWASTIAADGSINLVPYSLFNAVAEAPPMLAFSRHGTKHSATIVGEAREFAPWLR